MGGEARDRHVCVLQAFASRRLDIWLILLVFVFAAGVHVRSPGLAVAQASPTATPIATATPTRGFCAAGQHESIFSVAASGDDGYARRYDYGTYPPAASNDHDSTYGALFLERSLDGWGTYYATTVGLMRWNTATQPDGVAWPAGTVVSDALFHARYAVTGNSSVDGDTMVFEWYAWTPPVSDAQWTNSVPASGDATYAGADTIANATGYRATMLTHVDQINLSGYTGIRAGISGGRPTGFNGAQWYTWDYPADTIPEQLVVCWTHP